MTAASLLAEACGSFFLGCAGPADPAGRANEAEYSGRRNGVRGRKLVARRTVECSNGLSQCVGVMDNNSLDRTRPARDFRSIIVLPGRSARGR